MKKRIGTKTYDTETARYIDYYAKATGRGDHRYFEEALYLKRTGEYFLAGSGEGMSRYGRRYPNGMLGPGEGIIPITKKQADYWIEYPGQLLEDDYFSDMTEEDWEKLEKFNLYILNESIYK